MKESKITEAQIDEARESYTSVAFRSSLLFFCIVDLSTIDPMYQYSLQWFTNLFVMGIENAPASNDLNERLDNLNSYFTYSLYENVCRSLFEKHKLLFSLMLTAKILFGDKKIDEVEWRYFLAGPLGTHTIAISHLSNTPSSYLKAKSRSLVTQQRGLTTTRGRTCIGSSTVWGNCQISKEST